MDGVSGAGVSGGTEGTVDIAMLKKSQDLMKQQAAALIAALPSPPQSPNPPGVGGKVDIQA